MYIVEDRMLWKGIVELGLVDEFFREIKASLDVLKNRMVRRMVPFEGRVLHPSVCPDLEGGGSGFPLPTPLF